MEFEQYFWIDSSNLNALRSRFDVLKTTLRLKSLGQL